MADKSDIYSVFRKWSAQRITEKVMCRVLKGYHCYPGLKDKQCRECFEAYMRNGNE